jgi:hypothetical protein
MKVNHSMKSKGGKISMVASKQYHDMTCAEIENFVRDYLEYKLYKLSDEEVNDKYNSYFDGTFWSADGVEIKEEETK